MLPQLHIISSCTDGKRGTVAAPQRLGSYRQAHVDARFAAWWAAIEDAKSAQWARAATELYVGDHWSVSRELPALAQQAGWNAQLWTLSAGYGLVPAHSVLVPYAATFQPRHNDSVSRLSGTEQIAEQRRWWKLLATQAGPDKSAPRSVAELARRSPSAVILLVASPPYLQALQDDLLEAVALPSTTGALVIVSSTVRGLASELEQRRVASGARLTSIVQGSLISLHARVARWLIQTSAEHRFRMEEINQMIDSAARDLPAPIKYDREPATDADVRRFLRLRIGAEPTTSHTRLLREWRSAGHACEQSRFRELFREVQETTR